jgi:hypothetical protein
MTQDAFHASTGGSTVGRRSAALAVIGTCRDADLVRAQRETGILAIGRCHALGRDACTSAITDRKAIASVHFVEPDARALKR